MKKVKITLAVVVVFVIILAIIRGCMSLSKPDSIQGLDKNKNTKIIEEKIESLKLLQEYSFCKELYDEIKYYIEDDYINNRLGSNQSENDQWKNNLSTQLYSAYTEKFIQQAFYVFGGSEWDIKKLNFIRSEYQFLQKEGYKTGMLEQNSNPDKKLNEIKTILNKFDEIKDFINSCLEFSFTNDDLYAEFPISSTQNKIIKSKKYLKNNLENNYVKNCGILKDGLNMVPQILFEAHVKYLDNKISSWSGQYVNNTSQKDYSDNLFSPLKTEIDMLYNDIYKGINIDIEYKKLENKLIEESSAAYEHFN
jgi:hypothetical protein